jgi:hypothetical protein
MRRIIERVVTVVTTTTWTITWQDVPPQPSSEADPVPPAKSYTDDLPAQITPAPSTPIELKEANSESAQNSNETTSSIVVDSHPSKPERK